MHHLAIDAQASELKGQLVDEFRIVTKIPPALADCLCYFGGRLREIEGTKRGHHTTSGSRSHMGLEAIVPVPGKRQ